MEKLNTLIDHTLLKPEATKDQIITLCEEAKTYEFASVMVNSSWVKLCAEQLKGTSVLVASVVGFPLGAMSTEAKVFETKQALSDGAQEIDMVINIGRLKDNDEEYVVNEIKSIKALLPDKILKVIIETALLSDDEKILACKLVSEAKADFIKTSTGFSLHGATVEDVKLLREHVAPEVAVKAAGGVRSFEDVTKMVDAGATRIGTSSGVKLMQGDKVEGSY
ncbi:MAG: deoxyribose-phosphate aldolase [Erysipelothrix sp.]|nr:deoxyribose-phosphate aldolase [Erysipelothrix sp.]